MGRTKGQKENPELDLKTLVKEGREIGQSAEWMLFTRWEDRLHEPLDKVREELGFTPPSKYRAALEELEGSQMIRTQAAACGQTVGLVILSPHSRSQSTA